MIQLAMGWEDYHLHAFNIAAVYYGEPDPDWPTDNKSARRVKLDQVITRRCIDGSLACPPEDCGGFWGYAELLEIINDPGHEEHMERIEWLGEGFDPEDFDSDRVNHQLVRKG